jgi:hypothetical protein
MWMARRHCSAAWKVLHWLQHRTLAYQFLLTGVSSQLSPYHSEVLSTTNAHNATLVTVLDSLIGVVATHITPLKQYSLRKYTMEPHIKKYHCLVYILLVKAVVRLSVRKMTN